jgi:hypothetical protein
MDLTPLIVVVAGIKRFVNYRFKLFFIIHSCMHILELSINSNLHRSTLSAAAVASIVVACFLLWLILIFLYKWFNNRKQRLLANGVAKNNFAASAAGSSNYQSMP